MNWWIEGFYFVRFLIRNWKFFNKNHHKQKCHNFELYQIKSFKQLSFHIHQLSYHSSLLNFKSLMNKSLMNSISNWFEIKFAWFNQYCYVWKMFTSHEKMSSHEILKFLHIQTVSSNLFLMVYSESFFSARKRF